MNKVARIVVLLLCFTSFLITNITHAQDAGGITVTCDNGVTFTNGVEFVVNQMRPGFTYTATAIGIDGFDPVLAVLDDAGNGLCNDDDRNAATLNANLPSSGNVPAASTSAQVQFSQNSGNFANVSLVVGGFGDTSGEFVLLLEGMAATQADGLGDSFSVRLTPANVNSEIPLTTYMIAVTSALDPYMYLADSEYNAVVDDEGRETYCDDSGSDLCWGNSENLSNRFVSRAGNRSQLPGGQYDSMLELPLTDFAGLDFEDGPWYLTFVMTSYQQTSFGDYVVVFHGSTGSLDNKQPDKPVSTEPPPPPDKDPTKTPSSSNAPSGITVTCDNGVTFNNGVEVIVNQMRPGFTYTATAIGLNGFDPVLAVLDDAGNGLCNDDDGNAASFTANLPSSGSVSSSGTSAQVDFSQNSGQMANVSLVVGGFEDTSGEFVLLLQGMAATEFDGPGDAFSVQLTPGLVASSVPVSVYMIAVTNALDPYMYLTVDGSTEVTDNNGAPMFCDDAGSSQCWGTSESLASSSITRTQNRQLGGGQYDAMMQIAPSDYTGLDFNDGPWYLTFVMTSYQQTSFGDYVVAIHAEAR